MKEAGSLRETDFLRQRLSIAIQRGNALAIRGSLGLHKINDCEERDPFRWFLYSH